MTDAQRSIDSASAEMDSLRKVLKGLHSTQVKSEDERQVVKATALAWFNNHRAAIVTFIDEDHVSEIDDLYRWFIAATAKATLRKKYLEAIKETKAKLAALQTAHIVTLSSPPTSKPAAPSVGDPVPNFSPLISDPKMQTILQSRWQECVICIRFGAPLAATVMMGGILEGLLLAKINQLTNKGPVFTTSSAPKEKSTGKTAPLKDWMLKNFIDVAHELGWITTTAKDIGAVLRDYRNYIHPQKEFSHGISLTRSDAEMLWNVAKSMIVQILKP